MSAFSSTRKEDISLRLRAQNARNAKEETRKLELESQKMEDRLRELKMAMNREKEEREKKRRGGGFWQTGQTGTLNKYASEVLTKPEKRSKEPGKKKTVKVLKDTPLDIPDRPTRPGTMKFIAQQKPEAVGKENRQRGPKCGQCETNIAALTCQQCCEYFCSGCFAAFHMKGALRRHRSVPIQAAGPRQCMSPHPSLPSSARTMDSHQSYQEANINGSAHYPTNSSQGWSDDESPEAGGQYAGGALLYGEFNEEESAAAFQEAVMAFRTGGGVDGRSSATSSHRGFTSPSKVAVQVDSGTGTETAEQPQQTPEITFKEVNVGYLNRLMLKKHRRTELGQMPSPRLGSAASTASQLLPDSPSDDEESEKHVPMLTEDSLHALNLEVEQCRKLKQKASSQTSSGVSLIELSDSLVPGVRKNTCVVTEVDLFEAWSVNTGNDPGSESSTRNTSAVGSPSYQQYGRDEERGGQPLSAKTQHFGSAAQVSHYHGNRRVDQQRDFSMEEDDYSLSNSNQSNAIDSQVMVNSRLPPTSKRRGEPRGEPREEGVEGMEREKSKLQDKRKPPKSRPPSSHAAKARPPSSNKPRPPSAQKSRPGSRAWSRASMGEGVLTKAPGDALKEISQRKMVNVGSSYISAFNEFFTLGVQPEHQERTLTPTKDKPTKATLDNKRPGSASIKVSNKLYQMAPRSWRPDSSLSETVPADAMQLPGASSTEAGASPGSAQDEGSVMSYTYSGQLSGCPVDVRQGSMDLDDDDEEDLEIANDDGDSEEEDDVKPTLPPLPARGDFSPTRSSELTGSDLVAFAREASQLTRSSSGLGHRPRSTPRPLSGVRRTPSAYAEALSRQSFTRTPLAPLTPSPPPSDPPTSRRPHSGRTTLRPSTPQTVLTVTSPRPPTSAHSRPPTARPDSRAIVMDGEDLSKYDETEAEKHAQQDREDTEALDKLEWELASECGRLTADGQISRMSHMEDAESFSSGSGTGSARVTPHSADLGFDIDTKLRKDELEEEDTNYDDDEAEVRALP